MVFVSSSVKVWTADRFARRAEGKAEGFDLVVIVVDDVSTTQGKPFNFELSKSAFFHPYS